MIQYSGWRFQENRIKLKFIFNFLEFMQTRVLKTLTRIASLGSFAAAAGQLNMTVSAVSMQMKTLEAELDAILFDRSHRPPQLTPLGRTVCDHAQRLLEREDDLLAACRTGGQLAGRHRIGFVATASVRLLPGFLSRAQLHAPNAEFDIETGVSEVLEGKVQAGLLDAAVVTASPMVPASLSYTILRDEVMVLACPADAPEEVAALFRELPFYHFLPNSGIGKLIAAHVEPYQAAGTRVTYLDSVEAIMECVNLGLGFTLLPEPDVRRTIGPSARIGPDTGMPLRRALVLALPPRAETRQRDQLAALLSGDSEEAEP